jgi:hypothetical protein
MQPRCDQLLAGATLADDQRWPVERCEARDLLEHRPEGGRGAEHRAVDVAFHWRTLPLRG